VYGQAEFINSKDSCNLNYQLLLDTSCFAAVGLIFILVSLFFKLALAPFHLWAPDIYENSPNSSAFFFAVVPKISIFVILIRISYHVLLSDLIWSETIISSIGVLSVLVGSLGGLEQRKFKSLLAYSSISHTGYMLIAFVSESFEGFQMLFCYLIIYTGSGLCIWSVFMLLRLKKINNGKQNKDLTDFVLLKKSNKTLTVILTVALFSIAGIPPMIGFLAKLNIFLVAVSKGLYFISFLSIMFSVFSTFYYLRVIKILYFEPRVVGKLYYPIITKNVGVIVVLNYFFLFTFINPSILYLVTHKMSLLFTL
jgi:NADH-quinone oxidoreductase subunit N